MTAPVAPIATAAPIAPGSRRPGRHLPAMRSYYWLLVALLYLPIALLFLFSINANTTLTFPLKGLTLQWYGKLFGTPALLHAVLNSVIVGTSASVVATAIGTMVAVLLSRFSFRGRDALAGLAMLPLIVPYVVLAVALLVLFRAVGIQLSLVTIAIAHVVVALPYTTLIVLARLIGFDQHLEEAAMDLGASYPITIRLIILPIAAPAIVSALITAFTVSFDEFALALFLAGRDPTFPVYLYGQLRFANTLPVLIATAVLLMTATLFLLGAAERIRRR